MKDRSNITSVSPFKTSIAPSLRSTAFNMTKDMCGIKGTLNCSSSFFANTFGVFHLPRALYPGCYPGLEFANAVGVRRCAFALKSHGGPFTMH